MNRDLEALLSLRAQGLLGRVLLSHDGNSYRFGGRPPNPYEALFTHFLPYLERHDFSKEEIRLLIEENPAQALSVELRTS